MSAETAAAIAIFVVTGFCILCTCFARCGWIPILAAFCGAVVAIGGMHLWSRMIDRAMLLHHAAGPNEGGVAVPFYLWFRVLPAAGFLLFASLVALLVGVVRLGFSRKAEPGAPVCPSCECRVENGQSRCPNCGKLLSAPATK